ncbi:PRC-barrel domain-containing protein [Psychromonas sp. PT13]|uniref:PRC-barrel domain-containing protein n=1 Tax=Psychromonas sp. PT13 TaxID=3439547 RepID=UPI003EBECFD0
MKIQLKAKVICKDGDLGEIKQLLIDPIKQKATHVVIENKHNLLQLIIPLNIIEYTSDSVISINKTAAELNTYPQFIKKEFVCVPPQEVDFVFSGADQSITNYYTLFPYVIHDGQRMLQVIKEIIPEGYLKLKKGLKVKDPNDKVLGHIDELLIDTETDLISHIIMRKGHIFGNKTIAIPRAYIMSFEPDAVVLSIEEAETEALPEVNIKRAWK